MLKGGVKSMMGEKILGCKNWEKDLRARGLLFFQEVIKGLFTFRGMGRAGLKRSVQKRSSEPGRGDLCQRKNRGGLARAGVGQLGNLRSTN